MSFITNLAKGAINKIVRKSKNKSQISFLKEKWLKHIPLDNSLRKVCLGRYNISFRNPLDIIHTYEEIFGGQIYQFSSSNSAPTIFDCGAHIGIGTLYFKHIFPNAEVHCFEPDEINFQLLQANCNNNNLSKIHFYNAAIWVEDGSIEFSSTATQASSIVMNKQANSNDLVQHVKCIRLKKLLFEQHVDFLKMDIEGAEYKVVHDCAKELQNVQNFFLEYHGKANETYKISELLQILKDAGFCVYVKMADDRIKSPFITKTLVDYPYDVQLNIFAYRN